MKKYLIVATSLAVLLSVFTLYQSSKPTTLIDVINSTPGVAWKAGENKYFEGRSMVDIVGLMGTLETPESMKLPIKKIEVIQSIPENFDSRIQWLNCESIK
jgi:hypothetical protein